MISLLSDVLDLDVEAAKNLLKDALKGDKRRNGELRYMHSIRVANLLMSRVRFPNDDTKNVVIVVALFHDLLEDTRKLSESDCVNMVRMHWGRVVLDMVYAQTEDRGSMLRADRKASLSERVPRWHVWNCIIKLCDIADNFSPGQSEAHYHWSTEVMIPAIDARLKELNWPGPFGKDLVPGYPPG